MDYRFGRRIEFEILLSKLADRAIRRRKHSRRFFSARINMRELPRLVLVKHKIHAFRESRANGVIYVDFAILVHEEHRISARGRKSVSLLFDHGSYKRNCFLSIHIANVAEVVLPFRRRLDSI